VLLNIFTLKTCSLSVFICSYLEDLRMLLLLLFQFVTTTVLIHYY